MINFSIKVSVMQQQYLHVFVENRILNHVKCQVARSFPCLLCDSMKNVRKYICIFERLVFKCK